MEKIELKVFKFGGSSQSSAEKLIQIVSIIESEVKTGPIAIVVSAQGNTTDYLQEALFLASKGDLMGSYQKVDSIKTHLDKNIYDLKQNYDVADLNSVFDFDSKFFIPLRQILYGVSLIREASPQSLDLVLSFGERISANFMTELLKQKGNKAQFVDARKLIKTNDTYNQAVIYKKLSSENILKAYEDDKWQETSPVITGFLGKTKEGKTTTLGRNGSDYTATFFASSLNAKEVNVWTDVPGVMTADPNIVKDAFPLDRMSYNEALELAIYGARMFHSRTMLPLIDSEVPLVIKKTMDPKSAGTRIDLLGSKDDSKPLSVTSLENLSLIGLRTRTGSKVTVVGEKILSLLKETKIPVWLATQAAHGYSFATVISGQFLDLAIDKIEQAFEIELKRGEIEKPQIRKDVTLLSLVGEKMGIEDRVIGPFFNALNTVGIRILAMGQGISSRSISCVIPKEDTQIAVRTVHSAFNFSHQEVNLFIIGKGIVGKELISQITHESEKIKKQHNIALKIIGIADSKSFLYEETGIDLNNWQSQLSKKGKKSFLENSDEVFKKIKRLPVPILVDVTAAEGMEAFYQKAFQFKLHVVAANKKPLTTPFSSWQKLMEFSKENHRCYQYETTVGASLPIIGTLKNLVRTGDQVNFVEACPSGSLGFICNELMSGKKLSEAVKNARELGYTEPLPQEDLSGMDVARKALILAREMGMELDIKDVNIEPFINKELIKELDLNKFFSLLEGHDPVFNQKMEKLKKEKKLIKYLAQINPKTKNKNEMLKVGPVIINMEHPASRLRGSESIFAFSTERYQKYPMVVQGAGAGGAVTAAGVLADILSISQTLKGR